MYLHGREGDPCGSKGSYIIKLSCGAHAPRMPATSTNPDAFNQSYDIAKEALLDLKEQNNLPNVIVGSSFGGAVLMNLIQEGHWNGPSVFWASAHMKKEIRAEYNLPLWDSLPPNHRAIFIHSKTDALVLYQDAVDTIANTKERNGDEGFWNFGQWFPYPRQRSVWKSQTSRNIKRRFSKACCRKTNRMDITELDEATCREQLQKEMQWMRKLS